MPWSDRQWRLRNDTPFVGAGFVTLAIFAVGGVRMVEENRPLGARQFRKEVESC